MYWCNKTGHYVRMDLLHVHTGGGKTAASKEWIQIFIQSLIVLWRLYFSEHTLRIDSSLYCISSSRSVYWLLIFNWVGWLHFSPNVLHTNCPGLTCGIDIVKPRFLFKTVHLWSWCCLSTDTHILSKRYCHVPAGWGEYLSIVSMYDFISFRVYVSIYL